MLCFAYCSPDYTFNTGVFDNCPPLARYMRTLCWGGHILSRVQNDIQPLVPSTPHPGMKLIRRKSQNMHTLNLISSELQGEKQNKVIYGLTKQNCCQVTCYLHPRRLLTSHIHVALVTRCVSFAKWGGGLAIDAGLYTTPPSANRSHPRKGYTSL